MKIGPVAFEPPSPAIGQLVGVHTNCATGRRIYTREENTTAFRRATIVFVFSLFASILLGVGFKATEGALLGHGAQREAAEAIALPIVASVACLLPFAAAAIASVLYRKSRPRNVRYIGTEGLHCFEGRMFGQSRTIVRFADLIDVRVYRVRQFIQFAVGDPRYTGTSFDLVCTGLRGDVVMRVSGIYNDTLPIDPWEPIAFAHGAEHMFLSFQARRFGRMAG